MIKVIKEVPSTKRHNELEFYTTTHTGDDTLIVRDLDCLLERRYTIGKAGELEMGEERVRIKSFEQVIKAWESGRVWF